MKYSTIIDELNLGAVSARILKNPSAEVHSYAPISNDSVQGSGVVYVGRVGELPEVLPDGTNYIVAGSAAPETPVSDRCNLVVTDIEPLTLLVEVAKLIHTEQRLTHDMQELLEILYAGGGLQKIVDRMNVLSPNPIIIVDSSFKILAMTREPISERPDLELQRVLGHMVDRNIDSLRRGGVYEKTRALQYPFYSVDPNTDYGWITCLVNVYGVEAAQIGIMELYHEFSRYDYELSNFLCKLVSLELSKDSFYRRNQALMHSAFLSDLLNDRIRDVDTAEARARQLGWKLGSEMYVLTIFDRNFGAFDTKARLITEQLHAMLPQSRYAVFDSRIVFLLPTAVSFAALFDEMHTFEKYLATNHLSAGLSESFDGVLGVRNHYLQSLKAFELGNRGTQAPAVLLHSYGDHVCQHIGAIVAEHHTLTDFYHPAVAAIARADEHNGSQLLPTLAAYLKHPDNPTKAAEELFIHRNTLFYRINKLKQEYGLNLSDGNERLRIQLTLAFMEAT